MEIARRDPLILRLRGRNIVERNITKCNIVEGSIDRGANTVKDNKKLEAVVIFKRSIPWIIKLEKVKI